MHTAKGVAYTSVPIGISALLSLDLTWVDMEVVLLPDFEGFAPLLQLDATIRNHSLLYNRLGRRILMFYRWNCGRMVAIRIVRLFGHVDITRLRTLWRSSYSGRGVSRWNRVPDMFTIATLGRELISGTLPICT